MSTLQTPPTPPQEGFTAAQFEVLEEGWFFYDHAWCLLHEIMKQIPAEATSILDVGCGTGFGLGMIQNAFPTKKCVGVEPNNEARAIWDSRRLNVVNASATQLPFADGEFDFVFSSHVIEHIEDDATAFREIARVARRRAMIIVPDDNVDSRHFGSPHLRYYNRRNYAQMAQECCPAGAKAKVYWLPHLHMSNLIALIDYV